MNIRSLRWANPEQTALLVNDEAIVRVPEDREAREHIKRWRDAGNHVDPSVTSTTRAASACWR